MEVLLVSFLSFLIAEPRPVQNTSIHQPVRPHIKYFFIMGIVFVKKNKLYITRREKNMATVKVKKGEARYLKSGGFWIYDNEIDKIDGDFVNGDIVDVIDFDDYFLGRGFINTNSKITVRVMTRKKMLKLTRLLLTSVLRLVSVTEWTLLI